MGKYNCKAAEAAVPHGKEVYVGATYEAVDGMDYFLFPCGYFYNMDVQKAVLGDVLRFFTGERFMVLRVGGVPIKSGATDMLSRLRYRKPIKSKLEEWRRDAEFMGHSRDAVSDTRCLLVTCRRIKE